MSRHITASEVVPLIVFTLGGHPHAITTESVKEVLRMVAIRPMVDAPDWVAGMINLRGTPIVVVDLRLRFGLGTPERGLATPIIVTRTSSDMLVGLIADAITELHDVSEDALFPTAESALVTSVARIGPKLVNVADVDVIVTGAEHLLGR